MSNIEFAAARRRESLTPKAVFACAVSLLVSIALLGTPGTAVAGVASLQARWTQPRITACFIGGEAAIKHRVVDLTASWVQGTGLEVDFGSRSALNSCSPKSRDHIRIAFELGAGTWSALGQQAMQTSAAETMNIDLQSAGPEWIDHMILHEMGHALGMMHQEQNPNYACRKNLLGVNGTSNRNSELSRPVVPDDGKYVVSPFDTQSPMRAFTFPDNFTDGERSPCYAPASKTLAASDRELIARLYPPRPPDVSAATSLESISIVLDGALSQENYQYLVPELRRRKLVGVRKYIDHEGLSLSVILVREGLSPTARITKEFERHLCDENPHICSPRSSGPPVWNNQRTKFNSSIEQGECGTKALSKSIICLPNVRVQAQRILVESQYDPSKWTLPDYVVQNTRGCEQWDEACRSIVELSNPKLDKRYYEARLHREKEIKLTLPATIHRVPLEFRSRGELKSIAAAVEQVKHERAKDLGVSTSKIAIRLVEPVGNPMPQAFSGYLKEPVRSYADALLAMHFPVWNEATEKEFNQYAAVQVGLWDRHVDAKHCEFQRGARQLLFVTPYAKQPPQLDPVPDTTEDCAKERGPTMAPPTNTWDHGTHVAGILAAQVNGKGIAGVNPNMTLWSWELISGDQFNAGDDPFISAMSHRIDPKIINISQTFNRGDRQQTNALESILLGAGQRLGAHNLRLFVAAAGVARDELNRPVGRKVDDAFNCSLVPACWSHTSEDQQPRNLISVVALDAKGERVIRDGDRFGSDYGGMFDVAAVGSVTSTMHGNWLGSLNGSSMAAPYVTGLASLILGKARGLNRDLSPGQIKERILVTADRQTQDLKDASRYGRINFSRALDFENDIVVLKSSTGCTECTLRGNSLKYNPSKLRISYRPYPDSVPVNKEIPLSSVRRIAVDTDGITVYYIDDDRLRSVHRAQLLDPDKTLSVAGKSVRLDSIDDLAAAWFRPKEGQ